MRFEWECSGCRRRDWELLALAILVLLSAVAPALRGDWGGFAWGVVIVALYGVRAILGELLSRRRAKPGGR